MIWDHIKQSVSDRMFEEFDSLYADKRDIEFCVFIENGMSVRLNNLDRFQSRIEYSHGYHQYCNELLRQSFFAQRDGNGMINNIKEGNWKRFR